MFCRHSDADMVSDQHSCCCCSLVEGRPLAVTSGSAALTCAADSLFQCRSPRQSRLQVPSEDEVHTMYNPKPNRQSLPCRIGRFIADQVYSSCIGGFGVAGKEAGSPVALSFGSGACRVLVPGEDQQALVGSRGACADELTGGPEPIPQMVGAALCC